jgi:hypothetical protein
MCARFVESESRSTCRFDAGFDDVHHLAWRGQGGSQLLPLLIGFGYGLLEPLLPHQGRAYPHSQVFPGEEIFSSLGIILDENVSCSVDHSTETLYNRSGPGQGALS